MSAFAHWDMQSASVLVNLVGNIKACPAENRAKTCADLAPFADKLEAELLDDFLDPDERQEIADRLALIRALIEAAKCS